MKALSKMGLVELSEEERARLEAQAASAGDASSGGAMPESADDIERLLQETRAMLGEADAAAQPPTPQPPMPQPPPRQPAAQRAAPQPPPPSPAAPRGAAPPPPPPPDPQAPPSVPGTSSVPEGRPLEALYTAAGVPASPFPAEKMLKVLEGLRAMPPETRKAAILAMDAADDDWTIDDTLLDAERKARVLQQARGELEGTLSAAEQQAAADLAAQDEYQEQATAQIRAQIAELEALLQAEVTEVAQKKAAIQADLKASRDACAREAARIDQAISELSEIPRTFGSA
jgi:hypothetical protein